MQEDKKKVRFRIEKLWIGILIFYIAILSIRGAWHHYKMTSRYHKLEKQIVEAQTLNAQQKRKLARLQDPRYLEYLARDRLGLVKPGESIYKLSGPSKVKEENK